MKWMKQVLFASVFAVGLAASAWAQTPIRLVTYGTDAALARLERIAQAFERDRPGYRLEYEVIALAEYPQKVSVMVAAGSPPDVFQTIAQWKVRWAEQGILTDLAPYWERSPATKGLEIFPFMLDAATHKGMLVGVPFDYSSMAITLNADALNEAGLAVPGPDWTVAEYREYAIRLTRPQQGVYGTTLGANNGISNWAWAVNFNGNGWLTGDREEVLLEHDAYLDMLEYWLDLIALGAAPRPGQPASRDQWNGGYAMWGGWVHWGERMGTMATYDWAMVPYPKGPGDGLNFAQGHMWSMPVNARDPERSWVFLEWLLSPEGQRAIVEIDARQPLVNDPGLWASFFETVQPDKRGMMTELVLDILYGQNRLHTMQYWETWPDVERVVNQHLATVWNGSAPPASAMANAAAQVRAILAEFGR